MDRGKKMFHDEATAMNTSIFGPNHWQGWGRQVFDRWDCAMRKANLEQGHPSSPLALIDDSFICKWVPNHERVIHFFTRRTQSTLIDILQANHIRQSRPPHIIWLKLKTSVYLKRNTDKTWNDAILGRYWLSPRSEARSAYVICIWHAFVPVQFHQSGCPKLVFLICHLPLS